MEDRIKLELDDLGKQKRDKDIVLIHRIVRQLSGSYLMSSGGCATTIGTLLCNVGDVYRNRSSFWNETDALISMVSPTEHMIKVFSDAGLNYERVMIIQVRKLIEEMIEEEMS